MATHIESFRMVVNPFHVKDGYRVTKPIEIQVSFTHDKHNQVDDVAVTCKVELLSVINWIMVRSDIGDCITEKMVGIIQQKKQGKYA